MPTTSSTRPPGLGGAGRTNQPNTGTVPDGEAAPPRPVHVVARYGVGDLRDEGEAERLRRRLAVDGLVVFSGIEGPQRVLEVAAAVMRVVLHPDSDARGLTTLTDLGPAADRPNAAGFSRRELLPHTDRSGTADPPALLMTTCATPSITGGTCLLVDGKAVHDDLARTAPPAVAALLHRGSVLFGGVGGHLGSVLADGPAISTTAPGATSTGGARRMIRLRLDDLVMLSPQVAVWLPALRAAIDRHTLTADLDAGEGYLLDNHRWLHGRTAYTGPRTLYRLHGNPGGEIRFRPGIPLDPDSAPRPGTCR